MTATLFGLFGALIAGAGLAAAAVAFEQRRLAAPDAADWLAGDTAMAHEQAIADVPPGSLVSRVLLPLLSRLGSRLASLTPAARLDKLHAELLRAGLAGKIRAEDLLAINILTAVLAVAGAVGWYVVAAPPGRTAVAGCSAVIVAGVCLPRAWLSRKVTARREAIMRDLPDALDLMVIGMEAGVTFDGAIQVVAEHLDTPLGHELARTLAEMELGLSRRDALQNLKRRVDMPEVNSIVIALLQADALGMSVSKVLRVQATEMRNKRRQLAREKAGKLPVKILFPLIVFIFPPVFVVILGPVAGDVLTMFK